MAGKWRRKGEELEMGRKAERRAESGVRIEGGQSINQAKRR